MSVIDTLLALDKSLLKLPTKQIKIKRLSELTGKDVIFTLNGITQDRLTQIDRAARSVVDGKAEFDSTLFRAQLIYYGVKELRDEALQERFNSGFEPFDIVSDLFSIKEQMALSDEIATLSGLDDADPLEEIKKK